MSKKKSTPPASCFYHQGFSLLELLVVVSILAVLAGVVVNQYSGAGDDAKLSIAKHEMNEIRKALTRYHNDNVNRNRYCREYLGGDSSAVPSTINGKRFPELHPADFSFLTINKLTANGALDADSDGPATVDIDCDDIGMGFHGETIWDVDNRLGFNGPYIKKPLQFVDVGGINSDGTGSIVDITGEQLRVRGLADPFIHYPITKTSSRPFCDESSQPNTNQCYLDWHTLEDPANETSQLSKHGRPYLLFDLNTTDVEFARIVSMGANGQFDGVNISDKCKANGDDLVLCLFR